MKAKDLSFAMLSLLLTLVLLAGCGPTAAPTAPTAAPAAEQPTAVPVAEQPTAVPVAEGPSGQIVIAQTQDLDGHDPIYGGSGRPAQNILRMIYDSLYHRNNQNEIIPWLATSYENPDELTWRFHLREGVKFHNGNDFKANDVKFTLDRHFLDDARPDTRNFLDRIEVVDDYTVDIITKEPYAALMTRVVLWHMIDEEYFNEVGAEGIAKNPIGTGPFQFVEWIKDEHWVAKANPNYWNGVPKIETVIFRPIPETAARLAALEAGDVDITGDVPPDFVESPPKGITIATVGGTRVVFVAMNVHEEPFTDVKVRQALNYAVDMDAIIDSLLNGMANKIDGPILPSAFGYSPTPVYSYDPEKAKSLLAEAGYPDGFEMELDTMPTWKEMAEAVAGQLSQLGITANINVMEQTALYDKFRPGKSTAYLTSWGNSESDADGTLSKQFYSKRYGCDTLLPPEDPQSGYGDPTKIGYMTGYGNPEADAAITGGAQTLVPEERIASYKQALEIIVQDAPWVFLYNPLEIYAHRDRVQGWAPRPDALINLNEAWVTD